MDSSSVRAPLSSSLTSVSSRSIAASKLGGGAHEPPGPSPGGREPWGSEPLRDPDELLPPPSDLARPLAQPVAARQPEQPLAGPLEPRAQRQPEAGNQVVHALLVEAERVP